MDNKYLVSYSPSLNDYVMICVGEKSERIKMQQYIDARDSDEIIMEVSQEKYYEIYDNMEFKRILSRRRETLNDRRENL